MALYLPPHVAVEENKRFAAAVLRNVTIQDPVAREYTRLLQQVNPDLFMVRAHDTIDADLPLRPGFYHVLKRNQDAPMSVFCVHDNGAYCEPDSRVFDRLAAGNLTQRRVRDRLEEQDRIVREAVERENRTRNETRREELTERVKAATETRISMSRDTPWTQGVAGKRGARR